MANEWFILRGSKEQGPFTLKMLIEHKDAGTLNPSDEVRESDSFDDWAEAGYVDGLFVTKAHLRKAIRRAGPRPGSPQLRDAWWQEVFSFCEDIEEDYQDIQYDGFEPMMPPTPTERSDVSRPTFNVDKMLDEWMERYEDNPAFAPAPEQIWPNCPPGILNEFRKRLATLMQVQAIISPGGNDQQEEDGLDLSKLVPGFRPISNSSYELAERLGGGYFGDVWKATSPLGGPPVALKFCRNRNKRRIDALHNEMSKIQQLDHPGIARFKDEYLAGPLPFLKYEFIDGMDLRHFLTTHCGFPDPVNGGDSSPLDPNHAAALILKLAEIMAYVHARPKPIVHRDLKPANIFVSNAHDLKLLPALNLELDLQLAEFKIMDFGLAAHARPAESVQSGTYSVGAKFDGMGTKAYMSPEQKKGESARPSDDIFALGVIWHELLMGEIEAGPPLGVGGSRWHEDLKARGLSDTQRQVLVDCLEQKQEHRIQNAIELVKRMRSVYALVEPVGLLERVKDAIEGDVIDLELLETASPQVIQLLINSGVTELYLNGLTTLCEKSAALLASWDGDLELNGLKAITDNAALALGKWLGDQQWYLDRLTTLTPEMAEVLAAWEDGPLILDNLRDLSPEAARHLARYDGGLHLNGLKTLDLSAAVYLGQGKTCDELELNGLEELLPEVAAALECLECDLRLNGLESLTPAVASALTNHAGGLVLNGLKELPSNVAEAISKWQTKSLSLDGVQWLELGSAKSLAKWQGESLSLNSLFDEDGQLKQAFYDMGRGEEILDELATWRGDHLSLNGIAYLTKDTACSLARWRGDWLCLDSLWSLDPDIAEAFAWSKTVMLSFDGVEELSLESAKALARWRGRSISFQGLKTITPAAAAALAKRQINDLDVWMRDPKSREIWDQAKKS